MEGGSGKIGGEAKNYDQNTFEFKIVSNNKTK